MGKRKLAKNGDGRVKGKDNRPEDASDDSGSDEDNDVLNVDFEWFDPQPQHDFHGLRTLLRQLFDVDAQLFDLSALTDLVLSQPLLGSTVKVDGNETDPYAFLTVLNLHEHREKPAVKDLINYVSRKSSASPQLSQLSTILSSESPAQVGLILTERLINIPAQVIPPMYKMLLEEISWALAEKEPYSFSHYLILSKTYTEVASSLDEEDDRPQKKSKKANDKVEQFYFHPEDELLERHAIAFGSFPYTKEAAEGHSDSKRAFQELGIKPQGHMILIQASKFEPAVEAVEELLSAS